ncbi:hypothetical protein GCM10010191_62330 [Actinomadura vinacea]|uniref:HTH tetR-type domain-containing protein n=1 Tax=Actinomadura vinacea TaxID=115336 RepID=A0ABN3JUR3_9ACTN
MRTRDPAGKRRALVAAGLALAERDGLSGLSVNRVVTAAGIAKGSFFHLFGDRASYLIELHRGFHDRLAARTAAAIAGAEPGAGRLLTGTRAYLDGCLRERATRALLVEAQAEPAIVVEAARRGRMFARIAEPDFAAMGCPHPPESARLWVVMVREVAVAESESGAALDGLRAALRRYLGRGTT